MHTALLASLLLAATVDQRLAEPLRLLAEVGAPRHVRWAPLPHACQRAPRHGRAGAVGLGEDPDLGALARAGDVGFLADDDVLELGCL